MSAKSRHGSSAVAQAAALLLATANTAAAVAAVSGRKSLTWLYRAAALVTRLVRAGLLLPLAVTPGSRVHPML